jgi:hypothetical protein
LKVFALGLPSPFALLAEVLLVALSHVTIGSGIPAPQSCSSSVRELLPLKTSKFD